MFIYDLSIFLASTAFVGTNAKYGIPLSRYTVFMQNCPLGYDPKEWSLLFIGSARGRFFQRKRIIKANYENGLCTRMV